MKQDVPIFVKIDNYREVLENVNAIKLKIAEAKKLLSEIEELKNEENSELKMWRQSLEDADAKMEFVDKTLFELNL